MIKRLIKWWQSLRMYVIADPADNSVTLSRALFRHIRANARKDDAARVFMFRITGEKAFGFSVNPQFDRPTQFCDIQYNDRYRCIGFETLCPSVGTILYEYGLPADTPVKLSATVQKNGNLMYYKIERPHAKHPRKYTQG
ncbi:MAG: hypothetical protein Q4D56_06200 [Bacteroides sp.]|nr:hypothetical protein [Bacteroides sp.]